MCFEIEGTQRDGYPTSCWTGRSSLAAGCAHASEVPRRWGEKMEILALQWSVAERAGPYVEANHRLSSNTARYTIETGLCNTLDGFHLCLGADPVMFGLKSWTVALYGQSVA